MRTGGPCCASWPYEPTLVRNTNYVETPHTSGGHDYYHLSEDIADDAIHWLREQKAYAPDKPFFMYWAPALRTDRTRFRRNGRISTRASSMMAGTV